MKTNEATQAPVSNVINIMRALAVTEALAPFLPRSTRLDDGSYTITACDGEHTYSWLVTKKRGGLKVVETLPGLAQTDTQVREATTARDLVLVGDFDSIEEVLEDLTEIIGESIAADPGCEQS